MKTEYLIYFSSVEGVFIALTGYIRNHHPGYEWVGMWLGGLPFSNIYQPALFHFAAALSWITSRSPASAYHLTLAITYSLGAVTFYLLALRVSRNRLASFLAAILFSLFSPSTLFFPDIRRDVGSYLWARRLQCVVSYGDGPHVTGLMLAFLAVALLIRAIRSPSSASRAMAVVAIGAVFATNWPVGVVLCIAIFCYLIAWPLEDLWRITAKTGMMIALAYLLICPIALPSVIISTYANANRLGDAPVKDAHYVLAWALLLLLLAETRSIMFRWVESSPMESPDDFLALDEEELGLSSVSPAFIKRVPRPPCAQGRYCFARGLHGNCPAGRAPRLGVEERFVVLFAVFLSYMTLASVFFQVRILPQPLRFHLAMEAALYLLLAVMMNRLVRSSEARAALCSAVLVVSCIQLFQYRDYARQIIRPAQIYDSIEYQTARWFDEHMHGDRVYAPGSISFWMNAFTETPQLSGCCDQSIINPENFISGFIIPAGYGSEAEDADYSLLWLKLGSGVKSVPVSGEQL